MLFAAVGCGVDEAPDGLQRTPDGEGARVLYSLSSARAGGVPMPNDLLAFPDPTSRTGVRLNLGTQGNTDFETRIYEKANRLEGWGTSAPISVSFVPPDELVQPNVLDLANLRARHQNDDFEFADDAIYLVNLTTGVPVPLDLGSGAYPYILRDPGRYGASDTHASEPVLLWETADETANPATGGPDASRSDYEPRFDVDCDGVLDLPNFEDPTVCPNQIQVELGDVSSLERNRCVSDNLLTWYERETHTLIARPLLPLDPGETYAVVLTDRLVDAAGNPVRSPFETVYHPSQEPAAQRLRDHLLDPELSGYFGDLAGSSLEHVAFMWSFTTAPVGDDLIRLRNGLYGEGSFAWLAREYPATFDAARVAGVESANGASTSQPEGWEDLEACQNVADRPYLIRMDELLPHLEQLSADELGAESEPEREALLDSLAFVDHLVLGTYETPFFIRGGPDSANAGAAFDLDPQSGSAEVTSDRVPVWMAIPRATDRWEQPFAANVYVPSFGGSPAELLAVAGYLARSGVATVAFTPPWHGPDEEAVDRINAWFAEGCYVPAAFAATRTRARDVNGDGRVKDDSGSAFFSPDPFHTRDAIRQTVVDGLQLLRVLKSFDGRLTEQSFDGDSSPELAGDFDGDGTPDLGGSNQPYSVWGQNLGGLATVPLGALDPDVVAAAPVGGAGGLGDLASRAQAPGLLESLTIPMLGTLIIGRPASELEASDTRCRANDVSLRFWVVSGLEPMEVEFHCLDVSAATSGEGLPRGATVTVFNAGNGALRCGRLTAEGRLRLSVPADAGDRLELAVYDEPDAVDSYAVGSGCNLTEEANRVALINTWGVGLAPSDRQGASGQSACGSPGGCTSVGGQSYAAGAPLTAVQSGLGLPRQSPALRRFVAFAAHILDEADGVNYAPYYGLRASFGATGRRAPATGGLVVAPVGSQAMPIDGQVAVARAMGAVPFLRPDAADRHRYPHYADYVTPWELYSDLGEQTPHHVLLSQHVLEGLARLERHPPAEGCGVNEIVPRVADECHPACEDSRQCSPLEYCDATVGVCRTAPAEDSVCDESLFDADDLAEGLNGWGERTAPVPLRLARVAARASASDVEASWEPRLAGTPHAADQAAWRADKRILGLLFPYLDPRGSDGLGPIDPCQGFSTDRYVVHLLGRFFRTQGADAYYLSHPSSHRCLASGSCPVLSSQP